MSPTRSWHSGPDAREPDRHVADSDTAKVNLNGRSDAGHFASMAIHAARATRPRHSVVDRCRSPSRPRSSDGQGQSAGAVRVRRTLAFSRSDIAAPKGTPHNAHHRHHVHRFRRLSSPSSIMRQRSGRSARRLAVFAVIRQIAVAETSKVRALCQSRLDTCWRRYGKAESSPCTATRQGDPFPVLVVALTAEQPSPQSLRRLEHEYSLAAELDPAWAAGR